MATQHRGLKKKVLLMGKSGSGKTSMRSIIFANYLARDTMRLGPTLGVENSHVRFLGNLVLNLWDCGGQDAFMENYFESQRDQIFRGVEVLIYVFDIESQDRKKDVDNFNSCLDAIKQNSKNAHIFALIHKMDLIHKDDERAKLYEERSSELRRLADPLRVTCFGTSIWDETLADEIVLFEKATFLVISHSTLRAHDDVHRYEKISNIVKQFKLSCSKSQATFMSMQVTNQHFTAFIDHFTTNTYIMIILSNPHIQSAATNLNIQVARPHFEKFVQQNMY